MGENYFEPIRLSIQFAIVADREQSLDIPIAISFKEILVILYMNTQT